MESISRDETGGRGAFHYGARVFCDFDFLLLIEGTLCGSPHTFKNTQYLVLAPVLWRKRTLVLPPLQTRGRER